MESAQDVLLIVEDDLDHAFLLRRQIRGQLLPELEIIDVTTASEAAERLRKGGVRCVVLDLSLPDAKGLEAVRTVLAADPSVAIVVLTGTDSDELGRQALALGAHEYLVKGQHGPEVFRRSVVLSMERAKRQAAETGQAALANRMRLLLETTSEGICTLGADGLTLFANRTAGDLFGVAAEDLVGRSLHDFHECPTERCTLAQQLRSHERTELGEQVFRSASGHLAVLEVRTRVVQELGTDIGSVVCLNDVTARRLAQDELMEREAQLTEAQRMAHLGSWEWVPASDEVVWSDEMYRLTGLAHDEVHQGGGAFAAYTALVPLAERAAVSPLFEGWTPTSRPVHVVHRLVRPDGTIRWLQCRASVREAVASDSGDDTLRIVGAVQDITEQKLSQDALAHAAMHDALTGLPNRALLLDRMDRIMQDSRRDAVAVVYMDIDRFKWVNDTMNHAAGDALLIAVAQRFAPLVRPTDTLSRNGGDEFIMVCDGLDTGAQVTTVIERLARALERPFPIDGRQLAVTMSMGLAVAPADERVDSESLIRDADIAMYRAKAAGGARCEIFDEAMRDHATQRLELQADLHRALLANEIRPWYQPIVELPSGRVIGCEALARWAHPDRGMLLPDSFISHAEEAGSIVTLDGAMLAEACLQVADWNSTRPTADALTLSVNISSRQLRSERLVDSVGTALERSGLAPQLLCLEVTESVIMDDVAMSTAVLVRLREMGVHIAVDDFGTGYSSLGYLLSLPVDVLKIDRSFVHGLVVSDGPGAAIVRAIKALGHALGLRVVAEGVESQAENELLSEFGVDQGQGYLWGRAVPPEEATWMVSPNGAHSDASPQAASEHVPADATGSGREE